MKSRSANRCLRYGNRLFREANSLQFSVKSVGGVKVLSRILYFIYVVLKFSVTEFFNRIERQSYRKR